MYYIVQEDSYFWMSFRWALRQRRRSTRLLWIFVKTVFGSSEKNAIKVSTPRLKQKTRFEELKITRLRCIG
jgi:hypothetical protein